jgi:hypothetical protein
MSTRARKKEILSDDFKKRKIFWKNIAENFPPHITNGNTPVQVYAALLAILFVQNGQ